MLAVSFQFDYMGGSQIGFNDPVDGPDYKLALESAAARLGDQLQHDATIQMEVFSLKFTGSEVAHAASEKHPSLPQGGFAAPIIPGKILFGVDGNGPFADGHLEIFFFDEDDDFAYATDPTAGLTGNQLDFQAIITHELVHAIGFTSATNADGSDDYGRGVNTPGTWTLYDRYLSDSAGNRLINANPQSLTAFRMDTSPTGWPMASVGGPGPNQGLFFDGPLARTVYGGPVPLYSPSNYSLSSTASHLDSEGIPGPAIFSPSEHLMSHAIVVGALPQGLTLLEKAILADTGIIIQPAEGYEFGNANAPYPVSLAEDGARHYPSDLTLGVAQDFELEGLPSNDTEGVDNDGVLAISDFLVGSITTTIASVSVESSAPATLDAWIDWNQDGDWLDADEQVFVNQEVEAGINHLSFPIPNIASQDTTAARFRLSTQRDLQPTGLAGDGEVEDYQVTLVDASQSPPISVRVVDRIASISQSNNRFTVASNALTTFAASIEDFNSVELSGGDSDDLVTLLLADFSFPDGGLRLTGNGGFNTLRVLGDGQTLDLTTPSISVSEFQHLDLSASDATTIALEQSTVDALSPINQTILVSLNRDDRLDLRDADLWTLADPILDNSFRLTAINQLGGQVIHVESAFPWHNFLRAGDINSDGEITAADALRIINELARRAFSDPSTQQLVDPLNLSSWPAAYFDHNADNQVTALDALRVINDLARQSDRGESEAVFLGPLLNDATSTSIQSQWIDYQVNSDSHGQWNERQLVAIELIIDRLPAKQIVSLLASREDFQPIQPPIHHLESFDDSVFGDWPEFLSALPLELGSNQIELSLQNNPSMQSPT